MKKKHPEHVNHERWLVSYADFITLLFAFFVVMYAISQADLAKFRAVSQSLRQALDGGGDSGTVSLEGQAGGESISPFEVVQPPGGAIANLSAGRTQSATEPSESSLRSVREKLEESISVELGVTSLAESVQMTYDRRGLVLRLAAKDVFAPGESEPKADYVPLLDRIGRVLATTPQLVRIEGHTTRGEWTGGADRTRDDWRLSTERAAWLARYWLGRFDFAPARLSVAGLAGHHPLTAGRSPLELASNRRLEIIVLEQSIEASAR